MRAQVSCLILSLRTFICVLSLLVMTIYATQPELVWVKHLHPLLTT